LQESVNNDLIRPGATDAVIVAVKTSVFLACLCLTSRGCSTMLRSAQQDRVAFYESVKLFLADVGSSTVEVQQFANLSFGPSKTLTTGRFQMKRQVRNVENQRISYLSLLQQSSRRNTGLDAANGEIAWAQLLSSYGKLLVAVRVRSPTHRPQLSRPSGGLAIQCDKNEYRGVLALEGVTGKKAVNSDTMTVKN